MCPPVTSPLTPERVSAPDFQGRGSVLFIFELYVEGATQRTLFYPLLGIILVRFLLVVRSVDYSALHSSLWCGLPAVTYPSGSFPGGGTCEQLCLGNSSLCLWRTHVCSCAAWSCWDSFFAFESALLRFKSLRLLNKSEHFMAFCLSFLFQNPKRAVTRTV